MAVVTPEDTIRTHEASPQAGAVPAPADDRPAVGSSPDEVGPTQPLPGWVLSPGHVVLAALWGLFFVVMNALPLSGTNGLWVHVLYGEWILEHRTLPAEDPFMPLAAGIELLDGTWLTQVLMAAVENAGGIEWLSHLFAVLVLVTYLLVARACYLVSGSAAWSTLGVVAALALAGGRVTGFRAETFGALCFAVLLWLIAASGAFDPERDGAVERPWRLWLGVPPLFVLWANLHGSFIFGLALLASCFAGRALEVGWRARSFRSVLNDGPVRRWLVLTELGLIAALINPYGLDLLLDAFGFPVTGNPRAQAAAPQVAIHGGPGLALILSWVAIGWLLAAAPGGRGLPPSRLVPWLVFAGAAATGIQKFTWYAPLFALTAVPLASAAWSRWRGDRAGVTAGGPRSSASRPGCLGPSLVSTMLVVVVAFGAFVFSPLGARLVAGFSRTTGQLIGPGTPLAVTAYLQANPPRGRIFNSQAWGDWLVYEGPPGLEPFVTTRLELLPIRAWLDYQRASQAGYEWERIFDRYRIDTAVLDAVTHRLLSRALRFTDGWSLVYDDGQATVHVRDRAPETEAEAR